MQSWTHSDLQSTMLLYANYSKEPMPYNFPNTTSTVYPSSFFSEVGETFSRYTSLNWGTFSSSIETSR